MTSLDPRNAESDVQALQVPDGRGGLRSIPFRIRGSGHPILFLHGYPLDSRMWLPVISRLEHNYCCIAPDLRGFGRAAEEPLSFSMSDLARDMAGLLDSIPIRTPVTLCGLSMGGYVAMRFAALYPDRLHSLVFTNTRANADDEKGAQTRLASARKAIAEGTRPVVQPMLEKLLAERTRKEERVIVESLETMMYSTKPSTVAWAQLAMASRPDSFGDLQEIRIPSICIAGSGDPITPPDAVKKIADAVPGCLFSEDPNSSHMTPMESPDWFVEQLARILPV